jgi:hypothetical protein
MRAKALISTKRDCPNRRYNPSAEAEVGATIASLALTRL